MQPNDETRRVETDAVRREAGKDRDNDREDDSGTDRAFDGIQRVHAGPPLGGT
jgi:hypothetical protein